MTTTPSAPLAAPRVRKAEPQIPPHPHDNYSFDQLEAAYNFGQTSDDRLVLANLVCQTLDALPGPRRTVDIGCGHGIGMDNSFQRRIAEHTDEYWGVEPDTSIRPAEGIFTHFQHAILESAALPANSFDVAYSFMVMEHVADPGAFLRALHRCLKPGGIYFFITPNGRHYFVKAASALRRLGIDEFMLRVLRGRVVDDYHYPTVYACNTPAAIREWSSRASFETPRMAFLERYGPSPYMPGPLRPVFHALRLKRYIYRNPELLLSVVCRLRKPDALT